MDKVRQKLKAWAPLVAILAVCIGSLFIGMVIGSVTTRAEANSERAILVDSFAQTIRSKDQVIVLLAKSTIASTGAVLAQTGVTVDNAKLVEEKAKFAIEEAQKIEAASAARKAAEAKKLRKLK